MTLGRSFVKCICWSVSSPWKYKHYITHQKHYITHIPFQIALIPPLCNLPSVIRTRNPSLYLHSFTWPKFLPRAPCCQPTVSERLPSQNYEGCLTREVSLVRWISYPILVANRLFPRGSLVTSLTSIGHKSFPDEKDNGKLGEEIAMGPLPISIPSLSHSPFSSSFSSSFSPFYSFSLTCLNALWPWFPFFRKSSLLV